MKVYEDMKGHYIMIRMPIWEKGTEFMVCEKGQTIELIKIKGVSEDAIRHL